MLVVVACGGAEPAAPTSSRPPDATVPAPAPTDTDRVDVRDDDELSPQASTTTIALGEFDVFLAAVDEALVGTEYEGVVLEDADVFVAMGQLVCERLDDGATVEETLGEFLDELVVDGAVADDDAAAVGVVLGAAVETLCSRHGDLLE